MVSLCKGRIEKAVRLAEELVKLADEGSEDCDQDFPLVFFGLLLDSGCKIRLEAEKVLAHLRTRETYRTD